MRKTGLIVAAIAVSAMNLGSIGAGFWVYRLLEAPSQIIVQIPVAMVTGVVGVMLCCIGANRFLGLLPGPDYMGVFLLAFPFAALIFTGIHFLFTGYLTSFGNIVGAWSVQFMENIVALPMAAALMRSRHEALRS